MRAGQSGRWNYRVNQLPHGVTNDVHILSRNLSVLVLFDLHLSTDYIAFTERLSGCLREWPALTFVIRFLSINWLNAMCLQIYFLAGYCFLYVGYSSSKLFCAVVQKVFSLLLDSLDSQNEIIVRQMKLFYCCFLLSIALKNVDALYVFAGSGLELYIRPL